MNWKDPPLTRTPLDYTPIDATVRPITPTRFKAPTLKRASIAGLVAAVAIGIMLYFPSVALAALAIAVVCGAVRYGGKLADRLNDYRH